MDLLKALKRNKEKLVIILRLIHKQTNKNKEETKEHTKETIPFCKCAKYDFKMFMQEKKKMQVRAIESACPFVFCFRGNLKNFIPFFFCYAPPHCSAVFFDQFVATFINHCKNNGEKNHNLFL